MSDTELTIDQKIAIARIAADIVGPAILSGREPISLNDFSTEFAAIFLGICECVTTCPTKVKAVS